MPWQSDGLIIPPLSDLLSIVPGDPTVYVSSFLLGFYLLSSLAFLGLKLNLLIGG